MAAFAANYPADIVFDAYVNHFTIDESVIGPTWRAVPLQDALRDRHLKSLPAPPLRKVVERNAKDNVLECGHRVPAFEPARFLSPTQRRRALEQGPPGRRRCPRCVADGLSADPTALKAVYAAEVARLRVAAEKPLPFQCAPETTLKIRKANALRADALHAFLEVFDTPLPRIDGDCIARMPIALILAWRSLSASHEADPVVLARFPALTERHLLSIALAVLRDPRLRQANQWHSYGSTWADARDRINTEIDSIARAAAAVGAA